MSCFRNGESYGEDVSEGFGGMLRDGAERVIVANGQRTQGRIG